MNKKSIKFLGWALGLSMALAGVGVAVGASQKAPVETWAAATASDAATGTLTFTAASGPTMTQSGTIPTGASAAFSYGGTADKVAYFNSGIQLQGEGNMTLSFSNFTGYAIKSVVLSARSNTSKGAGALSFTAVDDEENVEVLASIPDSKFNSTNWYGAWSTSYVDIDVDMTNDSYKIASTDTVSLTISASANSIYIGAVSIEWEHIIPTLAYTAGGTSADLSTINGSPNSVTFSATNFDSLSEGIFSNSPANGSSTKANLAYSVTGTTVTVTATGKAVGDETFTISATGCAVSLTLNVSVLPDTTFDSLTIVTPSSAIAFADSDPFAVTGLVVRATYTVGVEEQTTDFSGDDLEDLSFTVNGNAYEIGDELDEGTGTKAVVVSYTDPVTGTTRSTNAYNVTISEYVGNSYTKVSTDQGDWRGTYLVMANVANHTDRAFEGSLATLDANNNYHTVTVSESTVTVNKTTKAINGYAFSIGRIATGTNAGKYYLKTTTNKYIGNTQKGNNLSTSTSEAYAHDIEWDGENNCVKITSLKNETPTYLSYNSGSSRFRYMDNYDSYKNTIALYRLNDNGYVAAANKFGSDFMGSFTCDHDSGTNNITNEIWGAQETAFNALSVDAQGLIARSSGNESGSNYEKAIARYDYIVKKYKTTVRADFMNRISAGKLDAAAVVNPLASSFTMNDANLPLIVTIVSLTTVAAAGLIFIRRKRLD